MPLQRASMDCSGQSTVEFAVIAAGLSVVIAGLAALWHAAGDGLFIQHALTVASHHIQGVSLVAASDIFLF